MVGLKLQAQFSPAAHCTRDALAMELDVWRSKANTRTSIATDETGRTWPKVLVAAVHPAEGGRERWVRVWREGKALWVGFSQGVAVHLRLHVSNEGRVLAKAVRVPRGGRRGQLRPLRKSRCCPESAHARG
eukprot:CAMPEP_0206049168 /NCGR_PEP_ID=MMETSP1466-20131121/26105_1 /ASSEMBLY_ACC=CAM_ASM_001126 /TAXON_ID=44452 /ORGANISM="Pavlova gyrans, Strain CCMP608" /LENGTH=130 /DNA_ID=CAMNT_0053424251 /DNA_START=436 /DNA_END=828 /DNA_ORIENTATION=-